MLSRIKASGRKYRKYLTGIAALFIFWAATGGRYHCLLPGREHHLYCAINRNTGFAHLTRGMNMDTIAALAAAATEEDIPVLQGMLFSDDHVAMMTAAEVLQKKGPKGHEALLEAFRRAKQQKDTVRAADINEYGDLGQKIY